MFRQQLTEERQHLNVISLLNHEVAIQSQSVGEALVAIQTRMSPSPSMNDLMKQVEQKKVIRTWLLRGTLHFIDAGDIGLMWSAFSPEWQTRWGTYLHQHVTMYQKQSMVEVVLDCLSRGAKTRKQLKDEINQLTMIEQPIVDYLLSPWGGILKELSYQRKVIPTNVDGKEIVFQATETWLKDSTTFKKQYDQVEALGIILLRYLCAYGPATAIDFAYWTGITITKAKKVIKHMEKELISIDGLYDNKNTDHQKEPAANSIKLLPKFDPFLLGHKEKFYLDERDYKQIFSKAGHIRAAIVLNGKVIGAWNRTSMDMHLFENVNNNIRAKLEVEIEKTKQLLEWNRT